MACYFCSQETEKGRKFCPACNKKLEAILGSNGFAPILRKGGEIIGHAKIYSQLRGYERLVPIIAITPRDVLIQNFNVEPVCPFVKRGKQDEDRF